MILVTKPGANRLFQGKNCQDFGCFFSNVKMVMDGCSHVDHSEVGTKIFGQMIKGMNNGRVFPTDIRVWTKDIFDEITASLAHLNQDETWKTNFLFSNFCFTIVAVIENSFSYDVLYCGDGYILAKTNKGELEVINLDEGYNGAPPYYAYNYIKPEYLASYRNGVSFKKKVLYKNKYKNVGVATGGFSYVDMLPNEEKEAFKQGLIEEKDSKVCQIINKNEKIFLDDVCIVM